MCSIILVISRIMSEEVKNMLNYDRFMSKRALRRDMVCFEDIDVSIDDQENEFMRLDAGGPNSTTFPLTKICYSLRNGEDIELSGETLSTAMQYNIFGLEACQEAARDIVHRAHKPPLWGLPAGQGGTQVALTTGNTGSNFAVLNMFLNEGDNVILGSTTYPGIITEVKAIGCNMLSVAMDEDGMDPESLRQLLSRWKPEDAQDPDSDIPKLLVCVPNHHNPTGAMLSEPRRREIYELARRYNLIIYEDDVYFFLGFDADPLPSFLSMDVDGRVVRADSLSKVLAPGFRLGFISMAGPLMTYFNIQHVSLVMAFCGMSTGCFAELYKRWKFEGFLQHTKWVTKFYKGQRDTMVDLMTTIMTGLGEWTVPCGGFFIWLRLPNLKTHADKLFEIALEKKVSFIPGHYFRTDTSTAAETCLRLNFSQCTPHEMREGLERLRDVILQARDAERI